MTKLVLAFLLPLSCAAQDAGMGAAPGITGAWPIVLLAPAPDPPPPPPPRPAPARPVLREYQWPSPAVEKADTAAFLLVLADSTVRLAIAVWQQDGALHFVAPDGTAGVARLDAIDRQATQHLNAERGLKLSLPETATGQ